MQANNEKSLSAGSVKLRLWYNRSSLSHHDLKNIVGVSRQSFNYYMTGRHKPRQQYRDAIALLTNNKVKCTDWDTAI